MLYTGHAERHRTCVREHRSDLKNAGNDDARTHQNPWSRVAIGDGLSSLALGEYSAKNCHMGIMLQSEALFHGLGLEKARGASEGG